MTIQDTQTANKETQDEEITITAAGTTTQTSPLPPTAKSSQLNEGVDQAKHATGALQQQQETVDNASNQHKDRLTPSRGAGVTNVRGPNGEFTTVLHKTPALYSDVAQHVATGRQPVGQQPTRRRPVLRGLKPEKGIAVYVTGIQVSDESDEEVGQMIKEHVKTSNIRVINYRVIRFRRYKDTVGCRIIVPESEQHKVLDPNIWPLDIKCRRWESPLEFYKNKQWGSNYGGYGRNGGYSGYGSSRDNDRNRDYNNDYDDGSWR